MQSGEECLDAAYGESLPALEPVALKALLDPGPVRGEYQVVIAPQLVHQPLEGALGIAQVDLEQSCLFGREVTELLLLYPHERLHLLVHNLRRRGPQAFEFLPEG